MAHPSRPSTDDPARRAVTSFSTEDADTVGVVTDPGRRSLSLSQGRALFTALRRSDAARNPYRAWRITLAIVRAGQVLYRCKGPAAFVLRRGVRVADAVWVRGLMGSEIPTMVWFGPNLRLPHAGRGLMIHSSVVVGSGVTLYHRVSLGVRDGRAGPTIGDDVEIGAGAVVLGPIHVAHRCRIGANAVLASDTEPGRTYVGIPAVATGRPA